jgi:hypothetical protein
VVRSTKHSSSVTRLCATLFNGSVRESGKLFNCLLNYAIEGKIEGTGIRERRCKQLLDSHKEKRSYWKLKERALDRPLWRTQLEEATYLPQPENQ